MNARDIIAAVVSDRVAKRHGIVVPNYAPANWWECDVMELSEAGYWNEFEVKVSKSDFFVDAGKSMFLPEFGCHIRKHDALATRRDFGPNRFTFVTPRGLLNDTDLPPWAGLIEVWKQTNGVFKLLPVKKSAPLLHANKLPESAKFAALTAFYNRMCSRQLAQAV